MVRLVLEELRSLRDRGITDHELEIATTGFTEPEPDGPAQYVQRVLVDDVQLDATHLDTRRLRAIDRIVVELGPAPSDWGRDRRPPSASDPPP